MSFCPNCGSYVSPGTNICSCGTTFGYDSEPEKEEETEFQKQEKKQINTTDEYCRQGRKLMDNGDFLKAIEYFDKALESIIHLLLIKQKHIIMQDCMKML